MSGMKSYVEELEDIIEECEKLCQRMEDLKNRMRVGYERARKRRKR